MPDRAIPCIKGDADHRGEKGAESACGNQRPSRPRGRVLRLVKQVCAVDGHGDRVTDSRTDDQRSTQLSNTNAARLLSAKVWPLQASKHASPAGVRELAPTTAIARRGRPWVRVGEAENLEVVRFSVALSIDRDAAGRKPSQNAAATWPVSAPFHLHARVLD